MLLKMPPWREDPAMVRPMLGDAGGTPVDRGRVGVRAEVRRHPGAGPRRAGQAAREVRIWSRLGNEKTHQFPSIVQALATWGARLEGPVLFDGEIVALDASGRPAGFQKLQGRIHLTGAKDVEKIEKSQPVALILFDLLRDGDTDLRGLPLTSRRARLLTLLGPGQGQVGTRPGSGRARSGSGPA